MKELQTFNHAEFGALRTVRINGEPWFVGKDVAEILGYKNTKDALITHIDDEDKRIVQRSEIATFDNHIPESVLPVNFVSADIPNRGLTVINESGLYSLVLSSKLPTAKKFKRWVTSEVLPSIRKHGGYIADQENLTPEQILAKAVLLARNVIEEKDRQLETMRPKALFADAVSTSRNSILVGDMAKLLKQNGVEIGQKRLFGWLREHGYLVKQKGASWNMPTQRSMEAGLFEIKETAVSHSDGSITVSKTTKITGKGQVFFVNKFMAEGAIREQPKNSTQDVR